MARRKTQKPTVTEAAEDFPSPPARWLCWTAALVLMLLGVVPMANLVTTGNGLPWWSEAVRQWLAWNAMVVSATFAVGYAAPLQVERLFERGSSLILRLPVAGFQLVAGLSVTLLSILAGWKLFQLQPVTGDEFVQRWHGHLLATGHLYAKPEVNGEFFSGVQALEIGGRWFSQFPIGGPALHAIGELIRAPWLINPLLACVSLLAFYHVARSSVDELTARVAALLLATCPFVVFMAGSQMNHLGALAFLWIALAALPQWRSSPDGRAASKWAAVIGGSLGIVATIRPLDAMLFGACIGVFQLHTIRTHPWLSRTLAAQVMAGLVPVAALLTANWLTVGSPLLFAYDALNGPEHRPGFHVTPLGFEHTPLRALYMASAYLMKLDVGLLAWPVPAVVIVAAALTLVRRPSALDCLLVSIVLGVMGGYAAYWSESYFLGPRFLFVIAPVLVLYTARAPGLMRERIRAARVRAAMLLIMPCWLLVAWTLPAKESRLAGVATLASVYRMTPTAAAVDLAVRNAGVFPALVFIPEGLHGRLAARLRTLGMRPLGAEELVRHADACTIVDALLQFDRDPAARRETVLASVLDAVAKSPPATFLADLQPNTQVSLVQGRALSPTCTNELNDLRGTGASLGEMMPFQEFDSDGVLAGDVVYARDFGKRNELLARRFGDRKWFVARYSVVDGTARVALEGIR